MLKTNVYDEGGYESFIGAAVLRHLIDRITRMALTIVDIYHWEPIVADNPIIG